MTNVWPIIPALYRRPGEGVPSWACQCRRPDGRRLLRKYRHASEMGCIPQSAVDAFKAAHGLTHDGHARALLYLETFAPPPGRAT